jgi:MFS family permease
LGSPPEQQPVLRSDPRPGAAYWSLVGASFISSLGLGVYVPVLSLHARSLGATAAMSGMLIASSAAARIIISMPGAYLGERLGRRPVIIAGTVLRGASAVMYSLAPSFPPLLFWLFLMGLGAAMRQIAILSAVALMSGAGRKGRAISTLQAGDLLGYCFGPAIGGFFADKFGLQAPFLVLGVLEVISATVVLLLFREVRAEMRSSGRSARGNVLAAAKDPTFRVMALLSISMILIRTGSYATMTPLYAAVKAGLAQSQIGAAMTMFSVALLIAVQVSGRWSDRGRRCELVGLYALIAGLAHVFIAQSRSFVSLAAALFTLGLGLGAAMPVPASYIADNYDHAGMGLALGALQMASEFGALLGPVTLGFIADIAQGDYSVPMWAGGCFVASAGAITVANMRRSRKRIAARGVARSSEGEPR